MLIKKRDMTSSYYPKIFLLLILLLTSTSLSFRLSMKSYHIAKKTKTISNLQNLHSTNKFLIKRVKPVAYSISFFLSCLLQVTNPTSASAGVIESSTITIAIDQGANDGSNSKVKFYLLISTHTLNYSGCSIM